MNVLILSTITNSNTVFVVSSINDNNFIMT